MILKSLILLITHLLIPLSFLFWLWRSRARSVVDWIITVLMVSAYMAHIFVTGRWDWIGYYFRYGFVILFFLALFISFLRIRRLPFRARKLSGARLGQIVQLFVLLLFGLLAFFAVKGYFYSGDAVRLRFPLKQGTYYVAQGGNSPLINYHNLGRAQKFALDISRVNAFGMRARGIYPKDPKSYFIFGDTVYAPCGGRIVQMVDSLMDQPPSAMDTLNVAGNFLGIRSGDVNVFLAHLKKGTIRVHRGDSVVAGQPVAQVGNSGFTTEPHLHIHAERGPTGAFLKGRGVPILFDGRFLKRNQLVRTRIFSPE